MAQRDQQQAQQPPKPPKDVEQPFSLSPAIFIPYAGPASQPTHILEPTERLQVIISNLDTRHEAVRQNMFFLIQQRREQLISKAREELDSLGEADILLEMEERKAASEATKPEIEAMISRLKVQSRKGEEYDINFKSQIFRTPAPAPASLLPTAQPGHDDGPAEMGVMVRIGSALAIKLKLAADLKSLIHKGVVEMKAYDVHAAKITEFYKKALERRVGKGGLPLQILTNSRKNSLGEGGGGGGGRGILSNRHEQSPVNYNALSRMNIGMSIPINSAKVPQPQRVEESIKNVARGTK